MAKAAEGLLEDGVGRDEMHLEVAVA